MSEESKAQDPSDLLSPELRAKLEAAHGEVLAVKTRAGVCAFRVFQKAEYDRFSDMLMNDKSKARGSEYIVKACVVHPDKTTFQAWSDKYPGILSTCSGPVLEFGGFEVEPEQKKYGTA